MGDTRGRLRRLLIDFPLTADDLLERAEPQHDPSAALARFVEQRDPLCTAPGCATSSSRCDLDHEVPWPHGPTASGNLRPRSRRCHRAKTFSWTVCRTADGGYRWSSPTGRTYTVPPYWDPPPTPRAGSTTTGSPLVLQLGPVGVDDGLDLTNGLEADLAGPDAAEAGARPHVCSTDCRPPF